MKTITNDELTRGYLQKLGWQNYLATTIFVVLATISLFWSLFHIGGDQGLMRLSNIMYPLSSVIGAIWAFITAYRARLGPLRLERHYQLAWLFAGSGLLANCFGSIYYTYLQMTGVSDTVPSPGDIGFTLFYPLTFVALLVMPSAIHFRKRVALDAVITTLCMLGVSWFFFISTVFVANKNANESLYTFFITVSYPFWDMLLILAVVLLIQRRTEPILRTSLIIFTTGILCQILADTGYAYTLAINTYYTGMVFIDPFWFIGFFLFGLSALYQYSALAHRAHNEQTHPTQVVTQRGTGLFRHGKKIRSSRILVQSTLIHLPLVILLVLTLYSAYSDGTLHSDRSFFMVVLTAIVGILVAIRYFIATRENEVLMREREQGRQEAEHLRFLSTELTTLLEFDSLLERIVIIATSDLGFDASILILNEKDDHPLYNQSRLVVHAATSSSTESITWRLEDMNLAHNTLLLETEKDVIWIAENIKLPPEVEKWHQEQNIHTTLFMPLKYQGRQLGSLGFASRTEQHFNQHDKTLAKAYAEQVAPIIEHTRLYQITCEQEVFAKAMANIAVRLNAAAVEPSEIQQIICVEAAYALRADYALLYGIENGGNLIPLALYTDEHEPHTTLSDWPPIYQAEYEAQILTELQPLLLQFKAPIAYGYGKDKALAIPAISSRSITTGSMASYPAPRETIDDFPTSLVRDKLVQRFAHAAIFAPLISGGDPLGLLILARSLPPGSHEKRALTSTELSQAQDFAEQAAVALTNAHLYQRQWEANRRLQELDQLKDQFMMTASHELRTPLTAVQGYIELIAQYGESLPTEQRQEFLQKARRSCEELVVLLGNVMDVSRLEIEAGIRPAHIEQVSLQEIIKSVLDLIEPQLIQEQREVHLNILEQLAVRADRGQLRQVLVNISANALKYSPPMTPIAFAACVVLVHGRYVIISVSDRGLGIAPEHQAYLFQRFVRLERDINSPIRGSGLGLYISRRLIESMGGAIWIESSGIPGEGSTFHIQLPLAE